MYNIAKKIGIMLTAIIFLLSVSIPAFALGPKIVKGQLFDNDYSPVSGATVLLSLDGRFIAGVMTDNDGKFVLQFESGENDICSLNILSKNYRGIFSDVEIYDDTTYVEYTLEEKPLGLI
jgi:hypothetical protein